MDPFINYFVNIYPNMNGTLSFYFEGMYGIFSCNE